MALMVLYVYFTPYVIFIVTTALLCDWLNHHTILKADTLGISRPNFGSNWHSGSEEKISQTPSDGKSLYVNFHIVISIHAKFRGIV
jgi:hypothetical protein